MSWKRELKKRLKEMTENDERELRIELTPSQCLIVLEDDSLSAGEGFLV
jgi:hypothetical protein